MPPPPLIASLTAVSVQRGRVHRIRFPRPFLRNRRRTIHKAQERRRKSLISFRKAPTARLSSFSLETQPTLSGTASRSSSAAPSALQNRLSNPRSGQAKSLVLCVSGSIIDYVSIGGSL